MVSMEQEEGSSSTAPHRMRITSGGQVSGYVNFALTFLKDNPDRALVLHTLPPAPAEVLASAANNTSMGASLLATPKLVSVAEKIKREYMASLHSADGGGKGKAKAKGIWQYTESGLLSGPSEQEYSLDSVLEGKTKPKLRHRPYLQITLSTRPLGLEEGVKGRNVTCQYIMTRRKKAKGAKEKEAGLDTATESHAVDSAASAEGGKKAPETGNKADKGIKRKSESSQPTEAARGGKKRKK